MCDFDEMKNKFRIDLYKIKGFIYTVSSVQDLKIIKNINCNKTHQLLSKNLCETGSVVCHKLSKGDGYMAVKFYNDCSDFLIGEKESNQREVIQDRKYLSHLIILSAFRIYRRVFVPNVLYIRKYDLEDELKRISRRYGVDAELSISHDVYIYIVGLDSDVTKAMIEVYKLIEFHMKRSIYQISGYYKMEELRKIFFGGIYLISRINCNEIILTGNDASFTNILNCEIIKRSHKHMIEKIIKVETIKLVYLMYYKRKRMEDILADCECYLVFDNEKLGYETDTNIKLKGFYEIMIKKCVKGFRELFQETIKIFYSDRQIKKHIHDVFTFCVGEENTKPKDLRIEKNDLDIDEKIIFLPKNKSKIGFLSFLEEKEPCLHLETERVLDFNPKKLFLSIGLRSDIKNYINQNKHFKNSTSKNLYEIEIDIDHDLEDFLCGKKNGKINKICKDNDCEVQITTKNDNELGLNSFEVMPLNEENNDTISTNSNGSSIGKLDYRDDLKNNQIRQKNCIRDMDQRRNNGYCNLTNNRDYNGSSNMRLTKKYMNIYIKGTGANLYNTICQLECEFPAEISFNLPEKHHRRIIGYGGKNIQKIMKKHGVYIKFMNEEERNNLGYNGNVVIKTPKRNKDSLLKMKEEVLFLADEEIKIIEPIGTKIFLFYFFEFGIKALHKLYSEFAIVYDTEIGPIINTHKIIFEEKSLIDPYYELSKEYSNRKYTKLIKINKDIFLITALNNDIYKELCQISISDNPLPDEKKKINHIIIDSSSWLDSVPKLLFSLFDSKLFFNHEPAVKKEYNEIDNYRVDFKNRTFYSVESNQSIVGHRRSDKKNESSK